MFSHLFQLFQHLPVYQTYKIAQLSPTCAKERNPTIQWPPVSNLFGNRGKEKLPFSRNRSPTEAGLWRGSLNDRGCPSIILLMEEQAYGGAGLWRGSLHKPALKLCIDRKCTTLMHNSFYPLFHQQTTTWLNSCRSPPKQTRLFCHTARGVNVAMVMKTKLNRQCLQVRLAQTWQDKKKSQRSYFKNMHTKTFVCMHTHKQKEPGPVPHFVLLEHSHYSTSCFLNLYQRMGWHDRQTGNQSERQRNKHILSPTQQCSKKRERNHMCRR